MYYLLYQQKEIIIITNIMNGVIYLMTNQIYDENNLYKIGFTQNIIQRKGIQLNSSPLPFYYKILVFSDDYKTFEKCLKNEIEQRNIKKENGEWINCSIEEILDVFYYVSTIVSNKGICYNGKRYVYKDNEFKEKKLPNCDLRLLGIKDGERIVCAENNEVFIVKNNSIIVEDKIMSLSTYMNTLYPRNTKTNEHRGQQYFKYKGKLISEIWDSLFNK